MGGRKTANSPDRAPIVSDWEWQSKDTVRRRSYEQMKIVTTYTNHQDAISLHVRNEALSKSTNGETQNGIRTTQRKDRGGNQTGTEIS